MNQRIFGSPLDCWATRRITFRIGSSLEEYYVVPDRIEFNRSMVLTPDRRARRIHKAPVPAEEYGQVLDVVV